MTSLSEPDNVGDYLISSRSFREYEAMFALTEDELHGKLLDCPGGASSFAAIANERGTRVTAGDPVYALPTPGLRAPVKGESDRGSAHTMAGVDRYRWDFYGDPEVHREMRTSSAAQFSRDVERHPDRYVAASLPLLPFDDRRFDLVSSSRFLFIYADRLDEDFHLSALVELHRTCRHEVRVFLLFDQAGQPLSVMVDSLLDRLERRGIDAAIPHVSYEFQPGGNKLLVLSRE